MAESILDVLDELYPDEKPESGQAVISSSTPSTSGGSGQGDANIKRYLVEIADTDYSLLNLVRRHTGEDGTDRGEGRTDFHADPIAEGHFDSFSVFRNTDGTESWACFSTSNSTGYSGGGLLEYLQARGLDKREAVAYLLDNTNHQKKRQEPTSDHTEQKSSDGLLLPPWEHVRADNPPSLAPSLIDGVLRRGHVGTLIAKAKSGKSWAAIALCVSVASGIPWLGFECGQGMCCYIDPELDQRSLDKRFNKVAVTMGADPETVRERVLRWGLRGVTVGGKAPSIEDVAHDLVLLREREQLPDLALICVDSCSALLGGLDENAASDVRSYFNVLLRVTKTTGAALFAVHHEGKAMSGDREAMGRSRGSAAWDDCPDVVLSLVQTFPPSGEAEDYLQEGERAYMLECAAIREFRGFKPKRLLWDWPLFREDVDGKTNGWKPKSSSQRGGRVSGDTRREKSLDRQRRCAIYLLAHMLDLGIGKEGIPASEAAEFLSEAMGETIKPATLKNYVSESGVLDVWQKSRQRWYVVPSTVPAWQRQGKLLE